MRNCGDVLRTVRTRPYNSAPARVAKLVDAPDLKSGTARCTGSIPVSGTTDPSTVGCALPYQAQARPGLLADDAAQVVAGEVAIVDGEAFQAYDGS